MQIINRFLTVIIPTGVVIIPMDNHTGHVHLALSTRHHTSHLKRRAFPPRHHTSHLKLPSFSNRQYTRHLNQPTFSTMHHYSHLKRPSFSISIQHTLFQTPGTLCISTLTHQPHLSVLFHFKSLYISLKHNRKMTTVVGIMTI